MAEETQYSSETTTTPPSLKRKYDDQQPPPRQTGFSSSPGDAPPPSYNTVPPPAPSGIELAKQRAQEVAARLLSGAPPAVDAKRSKFDNGAPAPPTNFDSIDVKPQYSLPTVSPSVVSYGHQGASKKIDIPNGRVGVIIGKAGETIKYLQLQSGAKIQVTRDMDADPNAPTRTVELMGTPDAIAAAEKLINEVLAEAEAGGSGIAARRLTGQTGSDEFVMKIPNNKVGLIIGKGGETIKNMQATTGARIQVIPLHLPPGDTSTERTLKIEGTPEQIESAKQVVNQVISGENRLRNPAMSGGYQQQGYQARPQSNWAPPQQPGYGYMQPGAYPGPSPQYPQPPYAGYPPPSSGGYSTGWDQSTAPTPQQSTQGAGYDYYGQQQNPGAAPPADGSGYSYSQPPSSGYNQPGQGYGQDGYGGYHAQPQSGYGQPPSYDQHQGYGSAPNYGSGNNPAQEGSTPNYGSQGDSTQAPPAQPPQGTAPTGYGVTPTSQAGYGQSGYSYGTPQTQKPSGAPPVYGQSQSPNTSAGYAQSGYPPAQPPPSGYAQQDPSSQRARPSGYGGAPQPGYGPPSYHAPGGQPGYGQAPPSYGNSYAAGYPQPPAYASDGNAGASARGSYEGAPAQTAPQGGVSKSSPQS